MRLIELRALNPVDIVVTKIGRLDKRYLEDIRDCITRCGLTRADIRNRAAQVRYVGNQEVYDASLEHVLTRFFND
jgi:hypothetical protein